MRSVKNALGMANTSSTYGTTLPMGSNLQSGYGGSNLGYGGSNLGYGSGWSGYGAQNYGQGFGTSGLASPLPAQAVVQTTTVPIDTPASPMMSQSPTMTPSSFSGGQQFGQGQQFGGQGLQGQQWNQGQQFGQGLQGQQGLSNLGQGQQFGGLQGQQLGQNQFSGQQFNQGQQSSLPVQKQYQQGLVQRREVAPVVHERIRREEVEEIQPVIHREREKTEVHKITQPIQTSSTLGIITEEGTLPAQVNPEIRTPGMMCPPAPLPTREQLSGQRMRVEKPAVIIETEKRNIIEEVQPVVYKEIVEPHIIRLTQPIYERIVEGEVYFNESLPARSESFQQPMQQQLPQQQAQHFLQPIQVQTYVQPIPVPMASPVISQPLMKENLEVAATYVSDFTSDKGRYGHKHSKGTAYGYGPGTTGAPLAQPRAV